MNKVDYYNRSLSNLSILSDVKIISLKPGYICPLCMRTFSIENAKEELTGEDVPQKSLGGKPITLTCKKCNNTCGTKIDIHLLESIKGIEQRAFLPGTDRKVYMQRGDKRLHATLKVGKNKDMSLYIDTKHNNPKTWMFFHENVLLEDSIIDLQDIPLKRDIRKISAAILKNAYLLLFARTGYTFLSDIYYDRMREQIMTPEPYILPERLWTFQNVSVPDGIYLTTDNRYRGFLVIYSIRLQHNYRVSVLIPTPQVEYLVACKELQRINRRIKVMQLPNDMDFMCDKESVIRLHNWVYGWHFDL